jgi:centriolar protein POC1
MKKQSHQSISLDKCMNTILFRKQVVSGGADGIVEVWNFKPQIRPFKFIGHKGAVNDVLFNADSTKVISCGDDR